MKSGKSVLTVIGLLAIVSAPLAGAEEFFIRVELSAGSSNALVEVSPASVATLTPRVTFVSPERPREEGGQGFESLSADLADVYRLREVYSLAESIFYWDGTGSRLPSLFRLEREVFRLDLDPRFLAPNRLKLRILVSRIMTKDGDLERLLDTDLVATLDDPIVAGFAYRGQPLFLTLEVSKTRPPERMGGTGAGREPSKNLTVARMPVRRVEPKLPEGVDLDSLNGEVVLRVSVDNDGRVTEVEVLKSLQTEVDRETVKALKEWIFEPVQERTGPGPTTYIMTFRYGTPQREPLEGGDPSVATGPPGATRSKKKSGSS
jgi:TonB family protein